MKKLIYIAGCLLMLSASGCKNFLDVVPDNVPTIDNAFTIRQEAMKYLFTCYSYLPNSSDPSSNPGISGGDEFWMVRPYAIDDRAFQLAMGYMSPSAVYLSGWGTNYRALRDCNIFLENIGKVVDMPDYERMRWIAEVKFLKAYYHWLLFRQYGPIALVDKNLPTSATHEEYKVRRTPVDSVISYISNQMLEAAQNLPPEIADRSSELGRITQPAALALRARVLLTAASPLFNGNPDHVLPGKENERLFSTTYDATKWDRAAEACSLAIENAHRNKHKLYTFSDIGTTLSDTMTSQMSIRNAVCEGWNPEIIWGNSSSSSWSIQRICMPRLDPDRLANEQVLGSYAPTLKIAEQFYTDHGVPINEDKGWDFAGRYKLRTATAAEKELIQEGYTTASLHFNRELRFYASLGFDGGVWYMKNKTFHIENKLGQWQSRKNIYDYNVTGYYAKKLIHWKNEIQAEQSVHIEPYAWPEMRLSDLYLMYAEALNESKGPVADALEYVNRVRARAKLPTVQDAWTNWSRNPGKYTTKEGLRAIIHQERLIELAFEGARFWDLRRWKTATEELNKPVMGWDMLQEKAEFYYRPRLIWRQTFQMRDYLWPIYETDLLMNENLVQNPGW